jgi:hypothetical protein
LKFGGEKVLTKHVPDDALKCQLSVEEPKNLVEDNALVVSGVQANPELESDIEVTQISPGINTKRDILEKMVPEIYSLEDRAESEKPVKIDLHLDLYQMEKV